MLRCDYAPSAGSKSYAPAAVVCCLHTEQNMMGHSTRSLQAPPRAHRQQPPPLYLLLHHCRKQLCSPMRDQARQLTCHLHLRRCRVHQVLAGTLQEGQGALITGPPHSLRWHPRLQERQRSWKRSDGPNWLCRRATPLLPWRCVVWWHLHDCACMQGTARCWVYRPNHPCMRAWRVTSRVSGVSR